MSCLAGRGTFLSLASPQESFDTMSSSTFKELRRALPMNRQKFPWEQVQHKLAMELVAKEKAAAVKA